MPRTPQEIFAHHASALMARDVDELVADYAEDAVIITPAGLFRGRDGVREWVDGMLADLPDATWDVRRRSTRATCCSSSGRPSRSRPG